jgi:endonuclease III
VAGAATRIIATLVGEHGRTYAAEVGLVLRGPGDGTPSHVFRLLCLSLLLSARIRAQVAVQATRALADHGWTTPEALAASTWEERTVVLNRAGYARYDEKTSRMLAATAERVLRVDGGDLHHLRVRAGYDAAAERELLQEFPGIGPLGASIFAREAQVVWPELYPYADERAVRTAERLGLPADANVLAALVPDAVTFARLVAALVRCGLAGDEDRILQLAHDPQRQPETLNGP